ncbi:MAG: transposase [Clostridiales bacterium]|nr:transposase [Clostridiales bacterium]
MPKRYPEEFKKQVTAICVSGAPLATISKKYNISLNTLYRWRKEYQQAGDQTTTKDYPTLYRQYERQDHIHWAAHPMMRMIQVVLSGDTVHSA